MEQLQQMSLGDCLKEPEYQHQRLLTDKFLSRYADFPEEMTPLGKFVYLRTYSRWLPELLRRETWKETCRRAVEYNCGLSITTGRSEAEDLYDNVYHTRQLLSGRTLWVGGTPVATKYPMSNFNCGGTLIKSWKDIHDLFYALMIGTGIGFRTLLSDVESLPRVRQDVRLIHMPYTATPKAERKELTAMGYAGYKGIIIIEVGDSKEGWCSALYMYLQILSDPLFSSTKDILICYDNVRPKGERLKTFGGTASGHESLKTMFEKIHKVFTTDDYAPKPADGKLRPIHVIDVCNIIGENVVVGGVRRTSEIDLLDPLDTESIEAKANVTEITKHRHMSNNSIFYKAKPAREQLHQNFLLIRKNGEPGFCNEEAAKKRNPNFKLPNPCFEALLDDKGMCNLQTTNVKAFVTNGVLNHDLLLKAHKLAARAALRMTLVTLELPEWDKIQKRDRLLGVSLTGWADAMNEVGYTREQRRQLLRDLRQAATDEVNAYADELGINRPILVTLCKPEGTQSQLAGVSSGVHEDHAPCYIRRVRINACDPLLKTAEALGWPIFNENGEGVAIDGEITPVNTKVIEFPVKSNAKRTKYDVSAIEQLETYYDFQECYSDGNTSITVTVRPDEWDAVEQNIWDNWDRFVGVSFLELDTKAYELMPYETITEEEYECRVATMKPLDLELFTQIERSLETVGEDFDPGESDCAGGACPIR